MQDDNKILINHFTTRVRQMILRYNSLKKENVELQQTINLLKTELSEQKKLMETSSREYQNLIAGKLLEITDGDVEQTKKRIAKIIRNLDKCITWLSDTQ